MCNNIMCNGVCAAAAARVLLSGRSKPQRPRQTRVKSNPAPHMYALPATPCTPGPLTWQAASGMYGRVLRRGTCPVPVAPRAFPSASRDRGENAPTPTVLSATPARVLSTPRLPYEAMLEPGSPGPAPPRAALGSHLRCLEPGTFFPKHPPIIWQAPCRRRSSSKVRAARL